MELALQRILQSWVR